MVFMNRKDLAKALKFSTVPREAPVAGALVSFYKGPIGHDELLVGTGVELEDYIASDLLLMCSSVCLVCVFSVLQIMLVIYFQIQG